MKSELNNMLYFPQIYFYALYSREDCINTATSDLKISMTSFMEKLWKKGRKEKKKGERMKEN